jgi:small nuclear ribonucleoprotein (snRNP)-like protein
MPIFRGRKPPKKRSFGGKPGKPGGRYGKPGKFGKFAKGGKKGKKRAPKRKKKSAKKLPWAPTIDHTGMERRYLKDLIQDETMVVVVLNTGERIRGQVAYYDRDTFGLAPADGSPKIFLRKENIRYLYEEPEEEYEELEEEVEEEMEEELVA